MSVYLWPFNVTQNFYSKQTRVSASCFLSVRAGVRGDLPLGGRRHWWHGHRCCLLIGCCHGLHQWPRADIRDSLLWIGYLRLRWGQNGNSVFCQTFSVMKWMLERNEGLRVWLKWRTESQDLICCLMGFNNESIASNTSFAVRVHVLYVVSFLLHCVQEKAEI